MRSLHATRAAAAAALLALPLSLAACSSGSSGTAASSAPSSSVATSAAAPSTGTSSSPGSDTGKPTKAEVAAGMTSYFVSKGVPRSLVGDVSKCVADKGYSEFSDATLRALKNGRIQELNPLDAGKLTKVTTTCLANGQVPTSVG